MRPVRQRRGRRSRAHDRCLDSLLALSRPPKYSQGRRWVLGQTAPFGRSARPERGARGHRPPTRAAPGAVDGGHVVRPLTRRWTSRSPAASPDLVAQHEPEGAPQRAVGHRRGRAADGGRSRSPGGAGPPGRARPAGQRTRPPAGSSAGGQVEPGRRRRRPRRARRAARRAADGAVRPSGSTPARTGSRSAQQLGVPGVAQALRVEVDLHARRSARRRTQRPSIAKSAVSIHRYSPTRAAVDPSGSARDRPAGSSTARRPRPRQGRRPPSGPTGRSAARAERRRPER